ncbi:PadR family transcriptional regulator [Streptosporangium sp. NPDC051022]|uniref:PadR family transcriptional regulator n=1 Tax=Streptosporangium sp. NPDC051022 TaxID=3155752 RepID=UPI00342B25FC
MKRTRQTTIAVLGALSLEPMTGYAVHEAIRSTLGHFWGESVGQIYPALAELERQGLVRRQHGTRSGSSTFAITADGEARLKELLGEPVQRTPPRNGLLLRLFFGRFLGSDTCRALLEQARCDAEQRLATLESLHTAIAAEDTAEQRSYSLITVSAGEHSARAAIAWADEALAMLDGDASRT